MTTAQLELDRKLKLGLKITQKSNRLWIDSSVLNTKTLVSYICKLYPKDDYRVKLKELITII
jgi:hypothetical protein